MRTIDPGESQSDSEQAAVVVPPLKIEEADSMGSREGE